MDNKNKYLKYKNKYMLLKQTSGGEKKTDSKKLIKINKLIIYQQKTLVINNINDKDQELLLGTIEDSVTFFKQDGTISDATVMTNNNMIDGKILCNDTITVIDTNGNSITGEINSIEPKIISLINNKNELIYFKKWTHAIVPNTRHKRPLFVAKEQGILQYMVNSIMWTPVYHLYLDSENLEESQNGTLYFMALITNNTCNSIFSEKVVLVAANIKTDDSSPRRIYETQSLMPASTAKNNSDVKQIPFSEMLTFPIKNSMTIMGEKYLFPLFEYKINSSKIYIVDLSNSYDFKDKKFIEFSYGYRIPDIDQELPSGNLKIFARSSVLDTTLSLGSVQIQRTPKNTPLEIIVGRTSRIRAYVNKTDSNTIFENGNSDSINDKNKYTITKIKITGNIVNDTENDQEVI